MIRTMTLRSFLQRLIQRPSARHARIAAAAAYAKDPDYQSRLAHEIANFRDDINVHDLPQIFHYWSHNYVRPLLEEVGVSNPDQFFAKYLHESAQASGGAPALFASVGAGNCDTEIRVAKLLLERGLADFRIECLDINAAMLERGRAAAQAEGVAAHVIPVAMDFNHWKPESNYHGIMANQSLHHVVELEALFDTVLTALAPNARFVISDMIGRNGHMRWPEALERVNAFWQELPESHRYNRQLQRLELQFENWDCSFESFEGIRAQDIMPLLVERFSFEVFIGFGNVVDVFVDRSFGHNFDAEGAWDRDFVDRLHACDEQGFAQGTLTPTHAMAVMTADRSAVPYALAASRRNARSVGRTDPDRPQWPTAGSVSTRRMRMAFSSRTLRSSI